MLKMFFGRWPVALFIFGIVCFGFGFYQSVNPGFMAEFVKVCYEIGATALFFWVFIVVVDKMNS